LQETALGFLWTLIIGLIAGAIAKLITPGHQGGGIIVTMLLGVVGAFLATFLGQALGWYGPNEGAGLIGAVVGALIVLFIWGAISRRRGV
jgi:uncharacterized membrane protein YeaQ/YmgE (transglycosylase-associated protein family)